MENQFESKTPLQQSLVNVTGLGSQLGIFDQTYDEPYLDISEAPWLETGESLQTQQNQEAARHFNHDKSMRKSSAKWMDFIESGKFKRFEASAASEADEDRATQLKEYIALNKENGGEKRKMAEIPTAYKALLEELDQNYGNFSEVTQAIREDFSKEMAYGDLCVKFRPILLAGPPGVGKTAYTKELARILNLPTLMIDFASADNTFDIVGMARGWAGSHIGKICDFLLSNKFGNGIIMIDEVDKAQNGPNGSKPINTLYPLLEPENSKQFTDNWLKTPINASELNYILTANYLEDIPKPILSRCNVFHIEPPTPTQMYGVVRNVHRNICSDYKYLPLGMRQLSDDVVEELSSLSPREIRKTIDAVIGKIADSNPEQDSITADDVHETMPKATTPRKQIGFF